MISRSSLAFLITALLGFHFRQASASAIAQISSDSDGRTANDRSKTALISINNKPYEIPLGDQIIPTDIVPPSNVTEASVDEGPQGFGCYFSERGNRPIGTFTVEDPIPRSPLPPKTPNDAEGTWPPIDSADALTCFKLSAKSSTYLVWVSYANDSDYEDNAWDNLAIDVKKGVRQTNGGSTSSSNPNIPGHSPKEELIFIQAGTIMGAEEFEDPGRPIAKAVLIDAPYPQSVCLLHAASVTRDQSEGSSSDGVDVKHFDLLDAAELEKGQVAQGIHCFRGW